VVNSSKDLARVTTTCVQDLIDAERVEHALS
jgi:hypothetical protein